jgi:hypothetical protein
MFQVMYRVGYLYESHEITVVLKDMRAINGIQEVGLSAIRVPAVW